MDAEAPTEIQRPPIPAIPSNREQCAACGAALAPDQRYCVECGQRRGGARPPFFEQPRSGSTLARAARPRRPLMSINATLIAGVGTLLLAMGIGILIGRSGQGSSAKAPAVQFLAAPGAAGSTAGGTTGSAPSSEAALPGISTSTTGAAGAKSNSSTPTSKPAPTKGRPPAPKAVKVGSKGAGRGYQKGKFTGNFFGEGEE